MGFLHGELIEAKKEISMGLKNVERNIRPVFDIIDEKTKGRLDNPLHLTGYLLNPYYFYKDPDNLYNSDLRSAIFKCLEAFFPNDLSTQCHVINSEFAIYKSKEGNFGKPWAILGCEKKDYDPVYWWETYGGAAPNLERMAKKILSLTTSSSGCEQNWSAFEGVHTKKQNRLDVARMNNLVFVQFNSRLMSRRKKQKEENIDILLSDHAMNAQAWIVDGFVEDEGDLPTESEVGEEELVRRDHMNEARELHEEDFISDEEEEIPNIDFDSDDEFVLELQGEGVYED